MFAHFSRLVAHRWLWIVLGWLAITVALRVAAPRWQDVTLDGDFRYLPEEMPSRVGERWMDEAFPFNRSRSHVVVVMAREDRPWNEHDLSLACDVARRMKRLLAESAMERARAAWNVAVAADLPATERNERAARALDEVEQALEDVEYFDQRTFDYARDLPPPLDGVAALRESVEQWRSVLAAEQPEARPELVATDGSGVPGESIPRQILDAWTWDQDVFGQLLVSRNAQARLAMLRLSTEFMATENIELLERLERELQDVRDRAERDSGLSIAMTGSAVVGADLLRAAAASIRHTELVTVLLVLVILVAIYRAPFMVAVPLVSIAVAFLVSTSLVAWLTRLGTVPGFGWWEWRVFTTTRIFIVVILFGAGTDYCLFLIARFREERSGGKGPREAVAHAMHRVGDALMASALTTIVGLSMLFFADFGKYRSSGPVIGLCLAVTLLVCLTLTPALLSGCQRFLFWPGPYPPTPPRPPRRWQGVARWVVARPGWILIAALVLLSGPAWYGYRYGHQVTYDLAQELSPTAPSRRGAALLQRHFPIGDSGPITVLVQREAGGLEEEEARARLRRLADAMFVPGVQSVRSSMDPLGELRPGQGAGLMTPRSRMGQLLALRSHPRVQAIFVSQVPQLRGQVARFDVILNCDPFSLEAVLALNQLESRLRRFVDEDPEWTGSRFAFTGTTAAIRDLRQVTRADHARIRILVVAAVLIVLLLVIRNPLISVYLVGSVILSYLVTIGATDLFFRWLYGTTYAGLDWKVPLFLFVILVAVGQDYNVYLVTRVLEEQRQSGPFAGLRAAIVRTGGIITQCGLIMAGTFASMTAGSWGGRLGGLDDGGSLRAMVELGFALSLGVLVDTFLVRPILVPAFLAQLARWRSGLPTFYSSDA